MGTYERKTAVAAGGDLGLVGVEVDLGMAQGTTAAVASDDMLLRPADRLSVDELNGSVGLGLDRRLVSICIHPIDS